MTFKQLEAIYWVARLGGFTRAAAELGVTQAAISRQIHLLEDMFGFPLFRRLHRRVELTEKGRQLSSTATTSAVGRCGTPPGCTGGSTSSTTAGGCA